MVQETAKLRAQNVALLKQRLHYALTHDAQPIVCANCDSQSDLHHYLKGYDPRGLCDLKNSYSLLANPVSKAAKRLGCLEEFREDWFALWQARFCNPVQSSSTLTKVSYDCKTSRQQFSRSGQ
ncbi:hypothetical protein C8J56DRAFT_1040466 [Mycena floridula]|nr:hypothetical protein C8J56DRAFT_1040466 [Mycena floridula]